MDNVPEVNETSSDQGVRKNELVKRILSGIVMAGASLALTVWSPLSFFLLIALGAALMGWEWRAIISGPGEGQSPPLALGLHLLAVLGALALVQLGHVEYGLGVLVIGAFLLAGLSWSSLPVLSFFGPFYTGLPALALIWLRSDPDYGLAAVLFVFLVVWMADIAAYGVGRTVGGPKLSPRISPNKTWSGVFGGLFGSALVGVALAFYLGNSSTAYLVIMALILGIASQLGDLYESSIKRRFKIKDSSNIIPGHGGILDRVDGLIAAATLAALIAFFVNPALPGHAILIW